MEYKTFPLQVEADKNWENDKVSILLKIGYMYVSQFLSQKFLENTNIN